jgi:lipoprotein NlpI
MRGLCYKVVGNQALAQADFDKAKELDPQHFANLK